MNPTVFRSRCECQASLTAEVASDGLVLSGRAALGGKSELAPATRLPDLTARSVISRIRVISDHGLERIRGNLDVAEHPGARAREQAPEHQQPAGTHSMSYSSQKLVHNKTLECRMASRGYKAPR